MLRYGAGADLFTGRSHGRKSVEFQSRIAVTIRCLLFLPQEILSVDSLIGD